MRYIFLFVAGLLAVALAAVVPAPAQTQYPNGYYSAPQGWQGVLSPQDQQQFDRDYSKWLDASRKKDQDDVADNARRMQQIMARYNIPANVPFDLVASNAAPNGYGYPNGAYPNGAYSVRGWQARLSPADQRKFDKDYSNWVKAQRKNDQDDIANNATKMQQIMARYDIPASVPFAAIATNGYAAGEAGPYPYGYPPSYGQPAAYPNAYGQRRLSPKDQSSFEKDYRNWLDAQHKKDMDDVNKNARKMEDIMARYNIPANVPFSEIAQGGPYR